VKRTDKQNITILCLFCNNNRTFRQRGKLEKLTVTIFGKLPFNKYLSNAYYLSDCSRCWGHSSEKTKTFRELIF
jgi:hypothetical protein